MAIFREILVKSSEFRPVFSPYFPPKSLYFPPNAAFEDYPVSSIDPWQSPVDSPWSWVRRSPVLPAAAAWWRRSSWTSSPGPRCRPRAATTATSESRQDLSQEVWVRNIEVSVLTSITPSEQTASELVSIETFPQKVHLLVVKQFPYQNVALDSTI